MMSDEDLIGPALPPSFSLDDEDDEEGFAGPALPPGYKPELLSSSEDDFGQEEEVEVVIKRRSKTSSRHGHGSGTTRDGHGHGSGTTRDGHGHGSGTTRDGHGHGSGTTRDGHGHGSGTTRDGHGHGSGTTRDGPTAEKRHRVDEAVSRRLTDEDDGFFGPALPPGFSKPQASPERPAVLGPALPPGFHRPASDDEDEDDDDDDDDFPRPALPPGYTAEPSSSDEEEEEDEEVIGPMPAQGAVQDSVALDIERRAQKMKDRLTGADSGPEDVVRETWMTELPPTLQHIGLGARTFKKRAGPESKDRSLWTDTPADRERKLRERLEGKETEEKEPVPQLSHKELQMAEKVSKYNETKRGESLISLHEKQMKKRKLDEGAKPVERRAFDRDQDLQVNKFDEAQKQRLLKKSQELNTRFGHSKEKMFL